LVAALRRLGLDYVFDTDFAADLTIMEEGTELLDQAYTPSERRQGGETAHADFLLPGLGEFLRISLPGYARHPVDSPLSAADVWLYRENLFRR
jgi:hypothetical protein